MHVLCEKIRLRLDPKKRPRQLGIMCNQTTFWVNNTGAKEFVRNAVNYQNYIRRNPNGKEMVSSLCFRSAISDTEGPYEYELIYDFSAKAMMEALPLILNTWQICSGGNLELVQTTEYAVRSVAMQTMASLGDAKLSTNHIALALFRYGGSVAHNQSILPEGLDLNKPLQDAAALEKALERVRTSPEAVADALEARLPRSEKFTLPEKVIIMLEADATDFYARLKKVSGSKEATALHFLVALLAAPSAELAAALTSLRIEAKQLKKVAESMASPGWLSFLRS